MSLLTSGGSLFRDDVDVLISLKDESSSPPPGWPVFFLLKGIMKKDWASRHAKDFQRGQKLMLDYMSAGIVSTDLADLSTFGCGGDGAPGKQSGFASVLGGESFKGPFSNPHPEITFRQPQGVIHVTLEPLDYYVVRV